MKYISSPADGCSKGDFRYRELLRWNDWGIDKIPTYLMACFYCLLVNRHFTPEGFGDFAMFFLLVLSFSIFGYMVNDYADRQLDLSHGKPNFFINATIPQCALIIGTPIAAIVVLLFILQERFLLVPLVLLWIFLAAFYSLKPLRFKERGLAGLIISVVCQFTLPFLMLFLVLRHDSQLDILFFTLYATAKGASLDIGHQRFDYFRDLSTRTMTYAVKNGIRRISKVYQWALALERLFLGSIIVLMTLKLEICLEDYRFEVGVGFGFILLIYIGLLVLNRRLLWNIDGIKPESDPYYGTSQNSLKVLHVVLPVNLIPLVLLMLMILECYWNVLILGLFLLWIRPTPDKVSWVVRSFLNFFGHSAATKDNHN